MRLDGRATAVADPREGGQAVRAVTPTHVVKSRHNGGMLHLGDEKDCDFMAAHFNAEYQSDEYIVELWDPDRAGDDVEVEAFDLEGL